MDEDILKLIQQRPFVPFQYLMKDGTRHPVVRLHQTVPTRVFAAYYSDTLRRITFLDYKNIAAIEDLKAEPAV